jgi:HEAT repeat protein
MNFKKIAMMAMAISFSCSVFAATEGFQEHIAKASNPKLSMSQRWAALLQATDLAHGNQLDEVKKFSQHSEWFLRNATLVALNKVDHTAAIATAKELISDKALVVRSAAVEILAQRMSSENKAILLKEIDKNYNFHKKSSLWIRPQILGKVAEVAVQDDRTLFAQYLFDTDRQVSELSARALEKLTGEKLGNKRFVENWREFVKTKKWM